tara:strand:- start:5156 stop:5518 length:363 start_codon:yes stop_codon:yes gene_type:complete
MVNKPKQQGTTYETFCVNRLNEIPSIKAQRLAEGGMNDRGDLVIEKAKSFDVIGECKNRTNLNLHQTLRKALEKSGQFETVVYWKKLKRKGGNSKRTPDGEPEVVAMTPEFFEWLLRQVH